MWIAIDAPLCLDANPATLGMTLLEVEMVQEFIGQVCLAGAGGHEHENSEGRLHAQPITTIAMPHEILSAAVKCMAKYHAAMPGDAAGLLRCQFSFHSTTSLTEANHSSGTRQS